MPAPRVSIRLGTDGKAQVQTDFVDIGDTGDAQSKRIGMAFQRDAAIAEAAVEKLNKTAQRLAAISPNSAGLTNTINPITGGSYAQADGAAQASARAIQQQMAAGEVAAQRLLASIDPLYAAQLRYDQALAEANTLQQQGSMTAEQLAAVQTGLKAQLADQTMLYGKQGSAIGNTRIAQMELMHVVRGSVDQFAAGAAPMQIFTMHLGMLGQAAAMSGESMGKVGAFLQTGWGLAATVAVVALAPLIAKLFDTGNATDKLVQKLQDEAKQTSLNDDAHRIFGNTLDGVTEALRKNRDALKNLEDQGRSAADQALRVALAEGVKAAALRASTVAVLQQQEANLKNAQAVNFGAGGGASAYGAQSFFQQQVDQARRDVAQAQADAIEAGKQVQDALSHYAVEAASRDPAERIKKQYEGPNGLVEQTRKRLLNEHATTDELVRQVELLKQREAAEIKAVQERDKRPAKNAGGTAIFDTQIAAFFDIANKYRGDSETSDKRVLESFFRAANENLDPEKTAWCAAFVNAVLSAGGVKGTGSLAAKSFLGFGKDDMTSPQKGDIVIIKGAAGDHVGFLDSIDARGNVRVLGGNTGNRVAEATYAPSSVLGIRRPPTPGEDYAADQKAAADQQKQAEKDLADRAKAFSDDITDGLRLYDREAKKVGDEEKRRADSYQKVIEGQQDSLILLQAEAGMAGLSEEQRKEKLNLLQKELDLNHELGPEYATRIQQVVAEAAAQDELRRQIDQTMASMDELRQFGDQFIDDVLNPDNWKIWGDFGKMVLKDLETEFLKLAALNPLKNLLTGSNLPTIAGIFAGLAGGVPSLQAANPGGANYIPPFPGNAAGTEYFSGGLTWVGEFGKELVRLPRGSRVTPAPESRRLEAANDAGIGSITFNMPIDATGADSAAVARLNQRMDELQAALPGVIVSTWLDARERRKIR